MQYMAEGLECIYCALLKGRHLFSVPKTMPQTRKAVNRAASNAKACSKAHVHTKAVGGIMREEYKRSAYFVKVPYSAPPTEPSAK